jgi:hypothetical protein
LNIDLANILYQPSQRAPFKAAETLIQPIMIVNFIIHEPPKNIKDHHQLLTISEEVLVTTDIITIASIASVLIVLMIVLINFVFLITSVASFCMLNHVFLGWLQRKWGRLGL